MNIEMNQNRITTSLVIVALLTTSSFSSAQAQQPTEEQVARILKRFPEADRDKDGKLSTEEFDDVREMFQSRQRRGIDAWAQRHNQRRLKIQNLLRRRRE